LFPRPCRQALEHLTLHRFRLSLSDLLLYENAETAGVPLEVWPDRWGFNLALTREFELDLLPTTGIPVGDGLFGIGTFFGHSGRWVNRFHLNARAVACEPHFYPGRLPTKSETDTAPELNPSWLVL
jgi:hypothetical protein